MFLHHALQGRFAKLRSVTEEDAPFTLDIRNDEQLTYYIPRVDGTIDSQRLWIQTQISKDDDWFFIIEDKYSNSVGTFALTEVRNNHGTLGRFISRGDPLTNIEACVLILDFAFDELVLDEINLEVASENRQVISLWKKLGAIQTGSGSLGTWETKTYKIYRMDYLMKVRKKVKDLISQF